MIGKLTGIVDSIAEDAVMRAAPGGRARGGPITDAAKRAIRNALATYLKPYLVA